MVTRHKLSVLVVYKGNVINAVLGRRQDSFFYILTPELSYLPLNEVIHKPCPNVRLNKLYMNPAE